MFMASINKLDLWKEMKGNPKKGKPMKGNMVSLSEILCIPMVLDWLQCVQ